MTISTHRYTLMCLAQSCSKLYFSKENILMFRSKIMISSQVSKKQLLPLCFGVLAFLVLLSSSGSGGSGTVMATPAAHQAFSTIDSWNNIHPFLMFDYN